MIILKISAFAIIAVFLSTVLKKERSEFSAAVQIGATVAVLAYGITITRSFFSQMLSMADGVGISTEYLKLFVSVLCICVISEITASFCKDSGMTALSFAVELSGRLIALSLCVPMIRTVFNFVLSLID